MTIVATKSVKLFALAITALSLLAFSLISRELPASANVDDTLEQIAEYRTWTRVTKEPIKGASLAALLAPASQLPAEQPFTIDREAIGGGWVIAVQLPGSGSDPDLISIFKKAGKGIGNIFRSKKETDRASDARPAEIADHGFSYGVVYANAIAALEMDKASAKFPVGSMIVRERLDSLATTSPTAVIAMVKRESGFSKGTGDWEFFSFTGSDLKLLSRQTAGGCAECHTKARDTDWVFLDPLKKH